ncbi:MULTISPECIES: hypothetical protein [unclassified Neptuniibacter]|uniref:hypothetical protein n=1 Tax=unclassified Neptuniibacter TaxID=2630693 RepID=UPI000C692B57|nr:MULTISPECIES: hypothetical protein [unclassified Neptuniibacter]MAY42998.1 hypothetical protein [Oceanospirillaceae bacterium]|tara:strand:- start:8550 stop:8888 length:339 start_codon:yes stop_codon:yes gene_type:complete
MLTEKEKRDLYEIIEFTIGRDTSIQRNISSFNERTVLAVEEMLNEISRCNGSMKELIVNLVSGSSILAKGWLKRSLNEFNRMLKYKQAALNGYGCMVSVKSYWKNAIIVTTI